MLAIIGLDCMGAVGKNTTVPMAQL